MLFGLIIPFVVMHVVEWLLPLRSKRWVKPLLFIGCWLFGGMIIYVGDPVNLPFALLALLLSLLICCEGTYLQRFSVFLILSSLGMSFNAFADSFLLMKAGVWLPRNILCTIIWLLVYYMLRRFSTKQEYSLPPRLWILLDVLALTPFAATLTTVLLDSDFSADTRDVILLTVVTLSSFGLLLAMVVLARQQKLEQEKSLYKLNEAYYRNLELEQFQVRRLRHDMANHLQTMMALPDIELRKYLEELINSPAMSHSQKYCENNVLNIVMIAKKALSEQKNVNISPEMSVPQEIAIRDADLCALFANSLDNAIEACEKLPDKGATILVKAIADKGLFVLQVQNPVNKEIVLNNCIPATTKQNSHEHGIGLISIREITQRYGGSMNISADNGLFTLLVYIPI